MKNLILALSLLLPICAQANVVNFIALGDAPYFLPEANSMFIKLTDQINAENPDFAVHVGDIRGGDSDCSNEIILGVADLFKRFQVPLIYTPGDNEWTDCHRIASGPNDPLERLAFLRQTFFSTPQSLGAKPVTLMVQGDNPAFAEFKENRMWQNGDALFATLHIVGSNNNLRPEEPTAVAEFTRRNAANIAWLKATFERAKLTDAKVVVLFFQANLLLDAAPEVRTGFAAFTDELRKQVIGFKGQILAVQGDFHSFLWDQPLLDSSNNWGIERPLANFQRLQVPGAPDVRGIKVRVDTAKAQPFSVEPLPAIDWEYAIELVGQDPQKNECKLTIEKWEHKPRPGDENAWYNLYLTVRTSEQLPENPAILTAPAPSPWAAYGKTKNGYDQVAIDFAPGEKLTAKSIIRYIFQTWDEKRGLVQTSCRIN